MAEAISELPPAASIALTDEWALNQSGTTRRGNVALLPSVIEGSIDHAAIQNIGSNTHGAIDSHISNNANPHSVTKTQIGLENVENTKVNLTATIAPTVNNDDTEGYSILSRWADITADKEYVALDVTTGAAVWTETTSSAAGSTTFLGLTDTPGAYTTGNSIYSVNTGTTAVFETTTVLTEPAANQFTLTRGTSVAAFQNDLTVSSACIINQNLSQTSDVNFVNVDMAGRYSVGPVTINSAGSPYTALDLGGVGVVFVDSSVGAVTLSGAINGVANQIIQIVMISALNSFTLSYNVGLNQKFFVRGMIDETIIADFGGLTLICDGTNWFDATRA